MADSDVIVGIIKEKYPEPSLKTPPEFASVYDLSLSLSLSYSCLEPVWKTVSLGNTFATSAFIMNKFIFLLKTT